jgi:hypothetical protein
MGVQELSQIGEEIVVPTGSIKSNKREPFSVGPPGINFEEAYKNPKIKQRVIQ